MKLNKYKIGTLIKIVDERNNLGIKRFYGININKEFMPTAADTTGLDEKKYKVVRKNRFVYSGMQTGRDKCIRIGLYMEKDPIIVSPAYTTFEIIKENIIVPEYFFMKFLSTEKDRLGWFYSDSSVRSNLDWDRFCDIEFELPSIDIQKKYVAIYKSMLENQKCYEKGLEDLKLTCDAYIEELRRKNKSEKIGKYLTETREKNVNAEKLKNKAVSNTKIFVDAKDAVVNGVDTKNYLIVNEKEFAYNTVTTRNADKLSIAYNNKEKCLVSPLYTTFKINNEMLLPEYLCLWFNRNEYDRYARFHSWGSARELYSFETLSQTQIPVPNLIIQKSIANIYSVYTERKEINEKLKEQIKNICPILIKGSIEEAKK